jgi:hypothetical protein
MKAGGTILTGSVAAVLPRKAETHLQKQNLRVFVNLEAIGLFVGMGSGNFRLEHEMFAEHIIENGRNARASHQSGQFAEKTQPQRYRKLIHMEAFHGGVGKDVHAHAHGVGGDKFHVTPANNQQFFPRCDLVVEAVVVAVVLEHPARIHEKRRCDTHHIARRFGPRVRFDVHDFVAFAQNQQKYEIYTPVKQSIERADHTETNKAKFEQTIHAKTLG